MNISFGNMISLLPLMAKKLEELTLDDLSLVADALGMAVEITPDLKAAAVALMAGQDIHSVADLVKSPESIEQLIKFIHGGISSLTKPPALSGEGWTHNVEELQI